MDQERKRMTPEQLMALLRSLPKERRDELISKMRQANRRGSEARCEDFFDKMDLLLPGHDASLRETASLLTRLRAGRPNLPDHGA